MWQHTKPRTEPVTRCCLDGEEMQRNRIQCGSGVQKQEFQLFSENKQEETMICLEMRSLVSYSLFIPSWVILAAVFIFGHCILCKKQTELYNSHMSNIKQAMEDTNWTTVKPCAQLCTSLSKFKRKTPFGKKSPDSEAFSNQQPGNCLQWKRRARAGLLHTRGMDVSLMDLSKQPLLTSCEINLPDTWISYLHGWQRKGLSLSASLHQSYSKYEGAKRKVMIPDSQPTMEPSHSLLLPAKLGPFTPPYPGRTAHPFEDPNHRNMKLFHFSCGHVASTGSSSSFFDKQNCLVHLRIQRGTACQAARQFWMHLSPLQQKDPWGILKSLKPSQSICFWKATVNWCPFPTSSAHGFLKLYPLSY